jgi:hypothetical protein
MPRALVNACIRAIHALKETLMPRPHEDIERHTPVDHRPGGEPIGFAAGEWWAIEIAHVEAARVGAAASTYETLIEKARTSAAKAHAAIIFQSKNKRRVIALIAVDGHQAFRHISSAWDDHRLHAEHRDVAESGELALFKFTAGTGEAVIDPASTDAYAFERVARAPQTAREILAPIAGAQGFRGALVFGSDDATASALVYRFAHASEIDAFRAGSTARKILGPAGAESETLYGVHPIKTFTSLFK